MPYALGGQERSIIMDAYQLGGSHSVLKSLQPTATQCKYAQFWKNVVAHVQISFRTQNFADAKAPTFSGKELVDAVVQYIKDIQFIQRSYYIPPVAQDSRTVAWKVCLLLLQARVIEPANAATRKSDDSNGRFTEAKRYRIRQDVNIDNDLADLMGSCSLSSIGPPSVTSTKESNKENRSADISYDAFLELFGPVPCEVTDDEMSCASSDSSNSESVSSERSFVSFWDLNFSDCMDIWREACLARLLSLTDIPVIEKLLKTSDHEDILPSNTRSSTLIHNLVLPPLVQAFIELLDDSPYLLSVTETDPAEIHPLTLLSPVLDHCTKRFSYSPHPSLLDTILSRRSSKVQTVLPERHADLHNAIYKLLQNNPDTAVEALQLYNLMLPWTRREYFRKLLKFLHVASAPDIPRLHRDFTNRDFLMNKFQDVIFSRAFVTEEARLKLLLFMLEYAKDIFGIPAGMKENVEARICAAAKCGAMEESVISETCHRKALYHRNRDISSQQSLMSLLMYCDQAMPVSREKAKFMSRFEQTYPAMFHQYFGTSV